MMLDPPLRWNPNLPCRMNSRKHKDRQNNIQALRREGEGGRLLTNVMDKGVTHRLIVLRVGLHEKNRRKSLTMIEDAQIQGHLCSEWSNSSCL